MLLENFYLCLRYGYLQLVYYSDFYCHYSATSTVPEEPYPERTGTERSLAGPRNQWNLSEEEERASNLLEIQ